MCSAWWMQPMQNIWTESQVCGASLMWKLQALEFKVTNQPSLIDIGQWDGSRGLTVYDDLFPHFTGGLRGRQVTVTSLEVFTLTRILSPTQVLSSNLDLVNCNLRYLVN